MRQSLVRQHGTRPPAEIGRFPLGPRKLLHIMAVGWASLIVVQSERSAGAQIGTEADEYRRVHGSVNVAVRGGTR
jgi:hypothetical protein